MWISKHIFIHDYPLIDDYLKHVLLPLADRELADGYFFIRYWDGGPHVRLRYKGSGDSDRFTHLLQSTLEEFKREHRDWPFQKMKEDQRVKRTEGEGSGIAYPNFSIQSIDYHPEIYRYGGENVMGISEDIFMASSKFASVIIQQLPRNKRYVIAYDMMYECGKLAEEMQWIKDRRSFFYDYHMIWKEFKDQPNFSSLSHSLKSRTRHLESKKTLKPYQSYINLLKEKMLDIYGLQSIYKEHEVYYILISHMHMLNNRLGVSPDREYIFSSILYDYYTEIVHQ
ncbi:lantibiotic biosynthesis protein [Oceanobacillus piezotolerans]|uniref:Lantibiotic biosynthesis protein n=1 Tax=Oceanobacillus piezotolerans TaxID=2448030 RepID=A0A498D9B0_9BACI|nr:thiopeptide-type bacteriocin biosynthesis protein [Oceanobacillus piezotolerans]RLL42886.1 lantibiotic biosynthesis protein [Oceanobacillus piezotolerans]